MSFPVVDFWKTWKGIQARLADLAHNLTWGSVNTAVKEQLIDLDAEYQATTGEPSGNKLTWATMDDDKVCDLCQENEGDYEPDAPFLPDMPGHPLCRCRWKITAP